MSISREEKPGNFQEYIDLIDGLRPDSNSVLWFRGCGRSTYNLVPSLFRHPKIKLTRELLRLEKELILRFRQRSLPFHSRALDDDWDVLFFMQHYGIPTRLLDWTESPLIGLYFAVMAAPSIYDNDQLRYSSAASVWVLNPVTWNRHALQHLSFEGGILSPGDDELSTYKVSVDNPVMSNLPLAIFGSHNSPRIVAQRGVFTISGKSTIPMEKLYKTEDFPNDCLVKITLKQSLLPRFRHSILKHGISESVVFPDLEGLSREIKREFEFS